MCRALCPCPSLVIAPYILINSCAPVVYGDNSTRAFDVRCVDDPSDCLSATVRFEHPPSSLPPSLFPRAPLLRPALPALEYDTTYSAKSSSGGQRANGERGGAASAEMMMQPSSSSAAARGGRRNDKTDQRTREQDAFSAMRECKIVNLGISVGRAVNRTGVCECGINDLIEMKNMDS